MALAWEVTQLESPNREVLCMDYSDAFNQMMALFEKLLHENYLPDMLTEPVKQILKTIIDENVLINYTNWDISSLLYGLQPHRL